MNTFHSGLDEKIKKNKKNNDFTIVDNLTVWTDLLGFGQMFSKNNWNMKESHWKEIGTRLKNFYEQHYSNLSTTNEYIFILNDGLVRTIPIEKEKIMNNELFEISLWLRSIVISHVKVNKIDCIGARTVLCHGERFINSFITNVCFEDLVANYSKKDGCNSSYPKELKEYVIMNNPLPLQMNTALSKSYILEEMGSKEGLNGNHFYIDESFFKFIKKLVEKNDNLVIVEDNNFFAIESAFKDEEGRKWIFGFKRSAPIHIDKEVIKTTVYRLEKFYPHDENPDEFHFNLY